MKNKLFEFLKSSILQIRASIERFPEAIIISFAMVVLLIIKVEYSVNDDVFRNIIMSLLFGFFIALINLLMGERFKLERRMRMVADVGIVLLMAGLYAIMPIDMTLAFMTMYISVVVVLFLCFLLAPYAFSGEDFGFYVVRTGLKFILTFFYTLVLFGGISGLVFAVESLFELDFSNTIYTDMMIISFGLFGVTYFLSTLEKGQKKVAVNEYPKGIRILFTLIIIPLMIAYTLILYAYFIRILVTFNWPMGIVASLVMWYGIVAWLTLFATESLVFDRAWLQRFRRWFPLVFIIPTMMMLVSLWIRIRAYGFTQPRYYVLVVGIWFIAIIAYTILSKGQKGIFYVVSGAALLLVSCVGPLGSLQVSFNSQVNRLTSVLESNNMLVNGVVVPNAGLEKEDKEAIMSILYYLDNIDFDDQVDILPSDFNVYDDTKTVFGFDDFYPSRDNMYYGYRVEEPGSIGVEKGYILPFVMDRYQNKRTYTMGKNIITLNKLMLTISGQNDFVLNLNDIGIQLIEDYGSEGNLAQEALTFTYPLTQGKLTVMFKNLDMEQTSGDTMGINYSEGYFIIEE